MRRDSGPLGLRFGADPCGLLGALRSELSRDGLALRAHALEHARKVGFGKTELLELDVGHGEPELTRTLGHAVSDRIERIAEPHAFVIDGNQLAEFDSAEGGAEFGLHDVLQAGDCPGVVAHVLHEGEWIGDLPRRVCRNNHVLLVGREELRFGQIEHLELRVDPLHALQGVRQFGVQAGLSHNTHGVAELRDDSGFSHIDLEWHEVQGQEADRKYRGDGDTDDSQ